MWFNPQIDIALISLGFGIISQIMTHTLLDKQGMKENQKVMKEKQKQFQELLKKNDPASQEQAEKIQKEMMDMSMSSMKGMPKFMIISMIIFLPLLGWVSGSYGEAVIPLFFPLTLIWASTNWFWWYFGCSLVISIFLNKIADAIVEKMKKN